jgi:hypothetical protein
MARPLRLEFEGKTYTTAEFSRIVNLHPHTIAHHLRHGRTAADIVALQREKAKRSQAFNICEHCGAKFRWKETHPSECWSAFIVRAFCSHPCARKGMSAYLKEGKECE